MVGEHIRNDSTVLIQAQGDMIMCGNTLGIPGDTDCWGRRISRLSDPQDGKIPHGTRRGILFVFLLQPVEGCREGCGEPSKDVRVLRGGRRLRDVVLVLAVGRIRFDPEN